jgi:hypothetical protein
MRILDCGLEAAMSERGRRSNRTNRISISLITIFFAVVVSASAQNAKLIDEFGDFCCEAFRARMDVYFQELSSRPTENGVVIFYGGKNHAVCANSRTPKRGEIELIMKTFENHINFRKFPRDRIEIKFGGFRESWGAEFWSVPTGGIGPKPKPTVSESAIKFKSWRAKSFKSLDLQCEP